MDTILISDQELKSLTDAILQRHGIDFSCYETKSLKRRILRCLHIFKFNAVHELWIRILKEPPFIYSFMDEVSVGLTAMFRDPVLWKKMRNLFSDDFFGKNSLSIWHAGCSSGEEVYTMAIVLKESFYKNSVQTRATDISNQSIEKARRGVYHLMKMEEYDLNYWAFNAGSSLKKYYTSNHENAFMDTSLIKHVSFNYHNLITDPFANKYDIILCRNVMIYFDSRAKLQLVNRFYESLNPGGVFII